MSSKRAGRTSARVDRRIEEAVEWLLGAQLTVPQPWPDNRKPGAVRVGGWPFQTGNETMADCDDAGIVLSALARALAAGDDGQPLDPGLAEVEMARRTLGRAIPRLGPGFAKIVFVFGLHVAGGV